MEDKFKCSGVNTGNGVVYNWMEVFMDPTNIPVYSEHYMLHILERQLQRRVKRARDRERLRRSYRRLLVLQELRGFGDLPDEGISVSDSLETQEESLRAYNRLMMTLNSKPDFDIYKDVSNGFDK